MPVDMTAAGKGAEVAAMLKWIDENENHDVSLCDCCGDGDTWHGVPGEHYNSGDPWGDDGPYAYNGGCCECESTITTINLRVYHGTRFK